MYKKIYFFVLVTFIISFGLCAQEKEQLQKATLIVTAESFNEVPSIASQMEAGKFIPAENIVKEVNPKKRDGNKAVPGKGLPIGPDPLMQIQNKSGKIKGKEPILTFEAASSNVTPTDPTGAVGPNHFVNSWNSAFQNLGQGR